jgi:hypothetical protein
LTPKIGGKGKRNSIFRKSAISTRGYPGTICVLQVTLGEEDDEIADYYDWDCAKASAN